MSIVVENLTKIYGQQKVVNAISFQAKRGQVLGFLGPNGAGKTTTMKIITGSLLPTEGTAEVCGIDVLRAPIEAKRKFGYLSEHNPLYHDMYIKEYLSFVGKIFDLHNLSTSIKNAIERTGLGVEQHKKIGMLSKGYRQRVGLAQALLHDPEVLILDEPTTGLDPNQLVDIRKLIKELGKDKTVVLSTHIMQEVQAVCDHVVIINKGNIIANDPIEALDNHIVGGGKSVVVAFLEAIDERVFEVFKKHIQKYVKLPDGRFRIFPSKAEEDLRPKIFRFAVDNKLTIIELYEEKRTIEQVFQLLTHAKN